MKDINIIYRSDINDIKNTMSNNRTMSPATTENIFFSSAHKIHIKFIIYLAMKNNCSFPGGSDGKESAHNAGDPGSIPGSGRSPGEGNGSPLQYS